MGSSPIFPSLYAKLNSWWLWFSIWQSGINLLIYLSASCMLKMCLYISMVKYSFDISSILLMHQKLTLPMKGHPELHLSKENNISPVNV